MSSRGMSFFAMPLLCFDNCPEKRDESNPHTIFIDWLPFGLESFDPELTTEGLRAERQFIPFFGTLQSLLFKGHMSKKDIPPVPCKKDISMLCIEFLRSLSPEER